MRRRKVRSLPDEVAASALQDANQHGVARLNIIVKCFNRSIPSTCHFVHCVHYDGPQVSCIEFDKRAGHAKPSGAGSSLSLDPFVRCADQLNYIVDLKHTIINSKAGNVERHSFAPLPKLGWRQRRPSQSIGLHPSQIDRDDLCICLAFYP
jgi:hypothetical protein